MASQVFLGPIPMKEKILDSLPPRVMATALLETGIGSGLSLGFFGGVEGDGQK